MSKKIAWLHEGTSFSDIFRYFLPELVTAFLLSSALNIIDTYFVGMLESTSRLATIGLTGTLIQFITKVAEGLSIGTVVLCGQFNGLKQYRNVGHSAVSAFWITFAVGGIVASTLYFGAAGIFSFFDVSEKMLNLGVQFLQFRAIGIFFAFLYFALIGFLRGIKKPYLPMQFFLLGGAVFIFFDYVLLFGQWGFPKFGLQGSAIAFALQYASMFFAALLYIMYDRTTRRYDVSITQGVTWRFMHSIIGLSWPVMLDKATLAAAKMWLVKIIAPLGKSAIASFTIIKEMEQLAFVPAIAFAQVITYVISNDYSLQRWSGIKANIKKVLLLASLFVLVLLGLFSVYP
jgi:putative MATE family efflux protein